MERFRLLRSDSCPSLRRLPSLAQSDFLSDCPHRDVHWTSHRGRSLASSPLSNHSSQISAELIFLPAKEADESGTEPYKEVRRESGEDDDDGWEKKQPGEMADPRGLASSGRTPVPPCVGSPRSLSQTSCRTVRPAMSTGHRIAAAHSLRILSVRCAEKQKGRLAFANQPFLFPKVADPRGFEPLTFASVVRRSNPTELRVQPNRLKESGV